MNKPRKPPLPGHAPSVPATPAHAPNPRRESSLRWQRSVRFAWDNGGRKGGGHGGRR